MAEESKEDNRTNIRLGLDQNTNSYENYDSLQKPKKKSLTWDQCTFTSILPSLKQDIENGNKLETSAESDWSFTNKAKLGNVNLTEGENFKGGAQEEFARNISPVANEFISTASPSSSGSTTTASTGVSTTETPPVSPALRKGSKVTEEGTNSVLPPPPGFIVNRKSHGLLDTDLETIAEDSTVVPKDSSKFINRRRVTLGANLDDIEYAEAMASQLVSSFSKSTGTIQAGSRRNSSFELQNLNIHGNNKILEWDRAHGTTLADEEMNLNEEDDIDVEALRKQVDSWQTFLSVDDAEEDRILNKNKAPTPARRHSTPPIHITPVDNTQVNASRGFNLGYQAPMNGINNSVNGVAAQMASIHHPGPVGQYPPHFHQQQINHSNMMSEADPQFYNNWNDWAVHSMGYYTNHQTNHSSLVQRDSNGVFEQSRRTQQTGMTRKTPGRKNQRQTNKMLSGSKQVCEALAEFRATGNRPSMDSLRGHVVEFSKDSHGSRFIQYKMETANVEEKEVLVHEILPEAVQLASHPFGNYVIQNFLLHSTPSQRHAIADTFRGQMIKLSTQAHGCRVVQHAIGILDMAQRNLLELEIVQNIYTVARNNHGTHVVQKIMNILLSEVAEPAAKKEEMASVCVQSNAPTSNELLEMVEYAVSNELLKLAVHPHSYRLVQQTLGNCDMNRSPAIAQIMKTIEDNYDALAVDQHGNFILQHILDNGAYSLVEKVQAYVCANVLELSQHKFGSHLVEKCLSSATKAQARAIVEQLLNPTGRNLAYKSKMAGTNGNESTLLLLSKDPYANFVVQRAFDAVDRDLRNTIGNRIMEHADVLSRFTYGRHILSHINRSPE